MLGRFLEYAVASPNPLESLDFYTRLGFAVAPDTGETREGTIALSDGRLTLRLCTSLGHSPTLVFTRPNLADLVPTLTAIGVVPEHVALGDHQFNHLECQLPGEISVMVTEARTHSPVTDQPSLLGWFEEIEIVGASVDISALTWEALGFVAFDLGDALQRRIVVANDSISLSLLATSPISHHLLVFTAENIASVAESLTRRGFLIRRELTADRPLQHQICLRAPEGTVIVVREAT